jgi:hypothetical protein
MVSSRFAGIKPLLVQIEGLDAQGADLHEYCRAEAVPWAASFRNAGRLQIGTVGGIMSEWWAASNRKIWAASLGIRSQA